jgi:hypothetical protein
MASGRRLWEARPGPGLRAGKAVPRKREKIIINEECGVGGGADVRAVTRRLGCVWCGGARRESQPRQTDGGG